MSTLSTIGLRRPSRAPERSAALLALQGQGLELSNPRKDSISPQSIALIADRPRLSPPSIISTPSDPEKNHDFFGEDDKRRPSAISFETEVSIILNLYMNPSRQSLRSEYDEVAIESDEEEALEEERISIPTFHQPKAYRDTIAPLLEHQFSGDRLTVPAMPSPMSVASMPVLIHPNATQSVPSLDLTPNVSPSLHPVYGSKAAISGTSIQITPDMSPNLRAHSLSNSLYEFDTEIVLEVPDVREADGWYDQPLSPVSPEEINSTLRDSHVSAVSPNGMEGYQRQLTLEALAPPQPQSSPNPRPVDYYEDINQPRPSRAVVSEIIDNQMVPPPLALNRGKSPSDSATKPPPVQQSVMHLVADRDFAPQSRNASLIVSDPIEGPMRTYLTPPPLDRLASGSPSSRITQTSEIEEMYRSGSAFSDSTVDSPVATAKFGKQLKKAFKLGKKKKKSRVDKKEKLKSDSNIPTISAAAPAPAPDPFTDDVESYKYGYWKSHALAPAKANNALPPPHRLQSPGMEDAHRYSVQEEQTNRLSAGTNSTARASLRPNSKLEDWPMSYPTDQNWYEANKQKITHDSLSSTMSAASTGYPPQAYQAQAQMETYTGHTEEVPPDLDRFSYHTRPVSRAGHVYLANGSTNTSRQIVEAGSISRPSSSTSGLSNARRSAGTPISYNNDLFEASGGRKRSGFGSRLFMSAEEKRKLKVKESIVVVGGSRMGGGGGRESGKALVEM